MSNKQKDYISVFLYDEGLHLLDKEKFLSYWFHTIVISFDEKRPHLTWSAIPKELLLHAAIPAISSIFFLEKYEPSPVVYEEDESDGSNKLWHKCLITFSNFKIANNGTRGVIQVDDYSLNENVRMAWIWHSDVCAIKANVEPLPTQLANLQKSYTLASPEPE